MSSSGSLYVIGLGPGDPRMLTEQAKMALHQSQVVIGYSGYFAGIQEMVKDKECIALPLTQETQRAQVAVDRALQGGTVCVISSGDAGIYGMASLVLEVLEQRTANVPCPEVVVVPGISAINSCASLLGAPIGHDFAVISLSDLLTPWTLIEKRLEAAAEADFITVLLNPKSERRDWQYGRAQEILARHRAPQTPVGLVRNAYRADQSVTMTTVAQMTEPVVDMLTTVIIGNSQTRRWQSRMVTPRGYPVAQTP